MTALVDRAYLGALAPVGRTLETVAGHAGRMWRLLAKVAAVTARGQVAPRDVMAQVHAIGVDSIPLVCITAVLSGVVTSQQGGYQFTGSVPLYVLGSVVTASVVLELGPVMTAVVLIGRVGARITAELGTMKVSEQIDALHSIGRDPFAVLAAPRMLAGLVAVPLLVGLADCVGIYSGMVAASFSVGLGPDSFFYGARVFWHSWDLLYSICKGVVFGFLIPFISVHMGFETRGGAEGVGRFTTSAVVAMILSVLLTDATFPPLFLE